MVELSIRSLDLTDPVQLQLARLRVMCAMTFPDDAALRARAEVTYWTEVADLVSSRLTTHRPSDPRLPTNSSDIGEEKSKRFLVEFLAPFGGRYEAILLLADSPPVDELNAEWTNRWWDIFHVGKLLSLIGSIHQHHPELGASFNKAMFILCRTREKRPAREFREMGESNLHKAWARFRPAVHLCAAYFRTESECYGREMVQDLPAYWEKKPACFDSRIFREFLSFAQAAQDFVTNYCAHGRRQPLVPKADLLALPEGIIDPRCSLPGFEPLTEAQLAALNQYQAPQPSV